MSKLTQRPLLVVVGTAAVITFASSALSEPIQKVVVKPKTNTAYFLQTAQDDPELAPLLENNNEKLKKLIADKLGKLKHLTPKLDPFFFKDITVWEKPTAEQLAELTPKQLIKIYYMLKMLEDSAFRKRIQHELESDTADRTGEHGGVICLQSGKAVITMLPNVDHGNTMDFEIGSWHYDPDSNYSPDSVPVTPDLIGFFHFHAREITPGQSMFSPNDYFVGANWMGFTEFLMFSRPTATTFSVDMALITVEPNGTKIKKKIDLDLGVWGE